jgi:acyl-CoA hydrolase/GNAT superfamily N-acetyltransferase
MNVQDLLRTKACDPDAALAGVQSGARVFVGSGCAEPQHLVRALCRQARRLHDIEIVHLLTAGVAHYVDDDFLGHFRHNAFFIGPNVRDAVREGRADYTPIFLSEIPELITSGQRPIDVALLQLSTPDRHGYCSLGIHVDIALAAIQSADLVIAEINPHMPRTHGNTLVHLRQLDHCVEVNDPILELPGTEGLDPVSMKIGGYIADLIEDGSCLQLGIGDIPNAVMKYLQGRRHLGVHSEMLSDGVIPLIESGVVDNSRKAIHTGKTLVSFVMGTRRLYDLVHDNPGFEFHPSDYVNDPRVIAQNEDMVAINSALQVDLTGQVVADSIGFSFFSGIGGQLDFIRGAAMSKRGKPVIALPSTAKGGTVSRIVSHIDEGAGVVTSRGDVHYVVTEYGVAYLHGKTIRERALALIDIAHPDFRGELLDFVRSKYYMHETERVWQQIIHPYPDEWSHVQEFKDTKLVIRPLKVTDTRSLQEFFYSHDAETIYQRYFHMKSKLGHEEALSLCTVDYERRMAFGAFLRKSGTEHFVGVARYDLNPRTNMASTAIVVHQDWRGVGLGTHLLEQLVAYARTRGIAGIYGEVLPMNAAMVKIHERMGHSVRWDGDANLFKIRHRFVESPPERS